MDRDALRVTAYNGDIAPEDGRRGVTGTASARRLARQAWLVRAAAVTVLAAGGIISYLLFSAV
jgi:hypothetical protein